MLADFILIAAATYSAMGLLFSIAFSARGAAAIDPVAQHTPLSFRLVILPGAAALWPWLLAKWIRSRRQERQP